MNEKKDKEEKIIFELNYEEIEEIYWALLHTGYTKSLEEKFYEKYLELREKDRSIFK